MSTFRELRVDHIDTTRFDESCGCASPLMQMSDGAFNCGHCGEAVYGRPGNLVGHALRCVDGACVWTSIATGIEVHRCGEQSLPTFSDAELAALSEG